MHQMCLIEYLLLALVYTTRGSLKCEEPCSCCRSGMCADPHQYVLPCKSCKDGYAGPSCYEPCPASCVNCSQLFYEYEQERECYQCKAGFYNGRYKDIRNYPLQLDCSLPCIENCEMCTSYYNCSRCKPQFFLEYGRDCLRCQDNCLLCTSRTDCLACEDGHIWDGRVCAACPANCVQCTSGSYCLACEDRHVWDGELCAACPARCVHCTSGSDCLACDDGYFWNGVKCVTCEAGYFGTNCSRRCPDTCKNNLCDKSTGICTGCNDGYFMNQDGICMKCPEHCSYCFSNELCTFCLTGYTGHTCQYKCSNCKPGTGCEQFSEFCLESCKNGFSGKRCNLLCNSNCFICDRDNPNTCVSCASDRYGTDVNCANRCSVNCINSNCSDTDGKCAVGCEHGYWGDKCEHICSKGCLDGKCNRSDGSCYLLRQPGYTLPIGPDNEEKMSSADNVGLAVAVTVIVCFVLCLSVCCILIKTGFLTLNIQLSTRWKQCRRKRSDNTNSSESLAPSDGVKDQSSTTGVLTEDPVATSTDTTSVEISVYAGNCQQGNEEVQR